MLDAISVWNPAFDADNLARIHREKPIENAPEGGMLYPMFTRVCLEGKGHHALQLSACFEEEGLVRRSNFSVEITCSTSCKKTNLLMLELYLLLLNITLLEVDGPVIGASTHMAKSLSLQVGMTFFNISTILTMLVHKSLAWFIWSF